MQQTVHDYFKSVDPVLYRTLLKTTEKFEPIVITKSNNYFRDICMEIINQQLSDKVADVIFARFEALFPNRHITPEAFLRIPQEKMREAGNSYSKISYMTNLAEKVSEETTFLASLEMLSDEDVIERLTTIKGIGRWTAEMFLLFSLGREDIFSFGDLGLRRAIEKLYSLEKDVEKEKLVEISEKWSPYRSYASKILWRSLSL